MDFFLLNSLTTTTNANGLRSATAIASTAANGLVFVDGSWNILSAGTYFLAVDAWRGVPGTGTPATGRAGAFSGSLSFTAVTPVMPPPSTPSFLNPAGSVTGSLASGQVIWRSFAYSGSGGFSINTDGSTVDTELGLYSSLGQLLANDDDGGVGTASLINSPANLAAGTYYLAIGGFNTVFATGFGVTPGTATGAFVLNGLVAVPEPMTPLLMSLGAIVGAVLHVRKRRMNR